MPGLGKAEIGIFPQAQGLSLALKAVIKPPQARSLRCNEKIKTLAVAGLVGIVFWFERPDRLVCELHFLSPIPSASKIPSEIPSELREGKRPDRMLRDDC